MAGYTCFNPHTKKEHQYFLVDIGDYNSSDKHFTANDAHNINKIKLIPSYI